MTTLAFRCVGLIVNSSKPGAYPLATSLVPWLRERGCEVVADADLATRVGTDLVQDLTVAQVAQRADLLIVFGGDGTLLNVANQLNGHDAPMLGVKMGGLGFLTEVMEDEVHEALEAVLAGQCRYTKRSMLQARILQETRGESGPFLALNDVVIARDSPARIVALETWANGQPLSRFLCDGIILATPTGSTAHSLAAGGPIIAPSADVFLLNPLGPHTLTVRPIVLDAATEITVRVDSADASVHVVCDGQEVGSIERGDRVVIRQAAESIRTVSPLDRDYFWILRTKLNWGKR